jgi:hypothetical protein
MENTIEKKDSTEVVATIQTPVEEVKVDATVPAIDPTAAAVPPAEEAKEQPVALDDSDIQADIQKRKEFAQKRIDKLVAQGHAKDEEVGRLKDEVARMRDTLVRLQEVKTEPKVDDKTYTEEQLTAAEAHAIELSETSPREAMRLLADINKERIKNERRSAISEVTRPTPDQVVAQEETKHYNRFVSQNKSSDPDLDFASANSAVRKMAPSLYETNREYYDGFGALRSVQLAADSMRAIEKLKQEKSTNRVQKALVKERVKTSIEPGSVGMGQNVESKPSSSPLSEYFSERESRFNRLSGII